jgi:hypothetical protein
LTLTIPKRTFNRGHIMRRNKSNRPFWLASLVSVAVLWTSSAYAATSQVSDWDAIAVQTLLAAGQGQIPATRTLAIVHLAIHDALNAIDSRYERYAFTGAAPNGASVDAAIASAAWNAIFGAVGVGLLTIPNFGPPDLQAAALAQAHAKYAAALANIPDGISKDDGIAVGQAAAAAILALRIGDHAFDLVAYTPGTRPGDWQPTPNPVPSDPPGGVDFAPAGLPGWGRVTPFALRRSDQFEPAGPPPLSGRKYARDYNEAKAVGEKNSITRTAEQTSIARFWYEGSVFGWGRIAGIVAQSRGLDNWETARLFALINIAMADGFIAGFQTKYDLNFWRPVTAIRAGDTDGNDKTVADPHWSSLLNTPSIPELHLHS